MVERSTHQRIAVSRSSTYFNVSPVLGELGREIDKVAGRSHIFALLRMTQNIIFEGGRRHVRWRTKVTRGIHSRPIQRKAAWTPARHGMAGSASQGDQAFAGMKKPWFIPTHRASSPILIAMRRGFWCCVDLKRPLTHHTSTPPHPLSRSSSRPGGSTRYRRTW